MALDNAPWPSPREDAWAAIAGEDQPALPQRFQDSTLSTSLWLEEERVWGLPTEEFVWPARFQENVWGTLEGQPSDAVVLTPAPSPLLPNIDNGLGKSAVKQDLVALEALLCEQETWGVFEKRLCLYCPPCWRRLDDHDAEVAIRRILADFGYDRYLTSGDYRELRRMLLVNPALQVERPQTAPPDAVNLLDGTLDLQTGEWCPHDPRDGFFHFLNLTYAQITNSSSGYTFERFADNISGGSPDVRRQLLELVSLLVTSRQVKAFFVLLGPSNTGKTQFGRFLTELLGHDQVETLRGMEDFSDKWTMGALKGKRLVTCLDLPDYPLSTRAVGTIKQLVGDDAVKGEYKRGALFTFFEKPILVCAGNHPLQLPNAEREEALLNRLVIIPFQNPVPQEEAECELYEKLLAEAPYIVGQALDVWQDLKNRNFVPTHSEVPPEYRVVEGNDRLKAVQAFIRENLTAETDAEIATSTLFATFCASPMATGMTHTDFARLFAQAVQNMGSIVPIKRVAGTDQRGYRGVRLADSFA